MPRRIIYYRRQLIRSIEAFLEATPPSHAKAQRIIHRCYAAIQHEAKKLTLDQIIWQSFIVALTDSVYYENQGFLRNIHEILLGHSSQNIARTVFSDDYRFYFTPDETEWYAQLLSMLDFVEAIPFASIHEATTQARQNKDTWATMRENIPEVVQAEEVEAEYQRRKALIEAIAARCPSPESIGDEKIYHVVLREVTSVLLGINIGRAAVYCGYPILDSPYTGYGTPTVVAPGIDIYVVDMSESVKWSRRVLDALTGKIGLFISWRLSKALTFDADILVISLH